MVVYHSSERIMRWSNWSAHVDAASSEFSILRVVGSMPQMTALHSLFLSEVRMRPDMLEIARENKVVLNDDFPFFLYLSLCMNQVLQDVFVVKIWTWIFIVLIFVLFACCHRLLHVGTAELLCVMGLLMIAVFAAMVYGVLKAIE